MSELGPVSSVPSPTTRPVCAICDRIFTYREWMARHDCTDGPVHESCCDECRPAPLKGENK